MMFKVSVTAILLIAYCNGSTLPETTSTPQDSSIAPQSETVNQQVEVQNDQTASCSGGCTTNSQCASNGGSLNCRCAWFGCSLYTAEADLTDVQQFEIFVKKYSGTPLFTSAEKAYRTSPIVPQSQTVNQQIEAQNDQTASCSGGCTTSSQCASNAGSTNCRCAWFGCSFTIAEADLTDVKQFEIFVKKYSGTPLFTSAEKAYRTSPIVTQSETTNEQVEVQNDERAPCGGGCVTSSQCAAYAGTTNCRCAWFGCSLYTAEADLTDVQQFETFIKAYSGTPLLTSAEKAYRKSH